MKYLFGILLLASSFNMANAACSTYTSLISVSTSVSYPVTNVVVEGYKIIGSHTIYIYISSLDYAANSYTCKEIPYQYLVTTPTSEDDFIRDEFIKSLKLGMTLGYKLSFPTNTAGGSAIVVGRSSIYNTSITTP